jgi:hypothetical protein
MLAAEALKLGLTRHILISARSRPIENAEDKGFFTHRHETCFGLDLETVATPKLLSGSGNPTDFYLKAFCDLNSESRGTPVVLIRCHLPT